MVNPNSYQDLHTCSSAKLPHEVNDQAKACSAIMCKKTCHGCNHTMIQRHLSCFCPTNTRTAFRERLQAWLVASMTRAPESCEAKHGRHNDSKKLFLHSGTLTFADFLYHSYVVIMNARNVSPIANKPDPASLNSACSGATLQGCIRWAHITKCSLCSL